MAQAEFQLDLEALAAMRPRASGFGDNLRKWLKANAEHRAFNAKTSADGVLELNMLDIIGEDWWTGGGITANRVKQQLDANKDAKTIRVLMNSPGGDAFEGLAIQSLLNRTGARIEFEIIGLAASAATVIAMAGDSIAIHEGAMFMVHEAWTFGVGNKRDLRTTADFLEKVDGSILDVYKRRTGRDTAELSALVEATTWMTAHEAVEAKFATSVIPAKGSGKSDKSSKAKAMAQSEFKIDLGVIVPDEIKAALELSDEELAVVADHRAKKEREFLNSHPLRGAIAPAAPPCGGMRTR